MTKQPKPIADYTKYDYKKLFWDDVDRKYEDLADRLAIQRLLPKKAKKFADIAGGYGRLADEYLPKKYGETIVFDYSPTLLKQAKGLYGKKITTKQGDIYKLPFADGELDALMMVRATHHFADIDKVINELYRVLTPGGMAVIEVANKKTIVKMARYILGKRDVNPFSHDTVTLRDVSKNGFYNYHPKFIEKLFREAGFKIEKVLSVSNFRSPRLKKIFKPKFLIALEKPTQYTFSPLRFGPSIYYKLRK